MIRGLFVGMMIPDGSNQYFSRLAQLVQRELSVYDAGMLLFDSDGSPALERRYIGWVAEQLGTGRVGALIYTPSGDNVDNFEELFRLPIPIVVLDREIPEGFAQGPIDLVLARNRVGMRLVVEHLREIGIRRVAYVSGSQDTETGRVRNSSFVHYCEELLDVAPIAIFQGDFSFESGRAAAENALNLADFPPEAVVAANDLMALGVMQVLQRRGYSIPNDVSVIGYDDIPLANWVYPSLTTVRQNVEEMAREAARHVVRRLEGDILTGGLRTPIEPELVPRDSSRRV